MKYTTLRVVAGRVTATVHHYEIWQLDKFFVFWSKKNYWNCINYIVTRMSDNTVIFSGSPNEWFKFRKRAVK